MDKTDIAVLNTKDDELLSDYFNQKEAGDNCTFTVTGRFLGLEEGNARISIESVEMDVVAEEEEEGEDEEEMEVEEPTGAEMVLSEEEDEDEEAV